MKSSHCKKQGGTVPHVAAHLENVQEQKTNSRSRRRKARRKNGQPKIALAPLPPGAKPAVNFEGRDAHRKQDRHSSKRAGQLKDRARRLFRKSRLKPVHRRKPNHKEGSFDATKGYPGEGPNATEVTECHDNSCAVDGHYHARKAPLTGARRRLEERKKREEKVKKQTRWALCQEDRRAGYCPLVLCPNARPHGHDRQQLVAFALEEKELPWLEPLTDVESGCSTPRRRPSAEMKYTVDPALRELKTLRSGIFPRITTDADPSNDAPAPVPVRVVRHFEPKRKPKLHYLGTAVPYGYALSWIDPLEDVGPKRPAPTYNIIPDLDDLDDDAVQEVELYFTAPLEGDRPPWWMRLLSHLPFLVTEDVVSVNARRDLTIPEEMFSQIATDWHLKLFFQKEGSGWRSCGESKRNALLKHFYQQKSKGLIYRKLAILIFNDKDLFMRNPLNGAGESVRSYTSSVKHFIGEHDAFTIWNKRPDVLFNTICHVVNQRVALSRKLQSTERTTKAVPLFYSADLFLSRPSTEIRTE
jgi:hypothetical protein